MVHHTSSVVINIIHIKNLPVLKAENDPPVGPDRHCPETLEIASERMQMETGQIHISNASGGIQNSQNVFDLLYMVWPYLAGVVLLVEAFEPLVPKMSNHIY
jgi:hypothetical protein